VGGLQVTGRGQITAQIQSTKSATYRCRLNDGEFIDCKLHLIGHELIYIFEGADGQIFQNLVSGRYTLFIEANRIEDTREFATDFAGPITMAIGIDTDNSRAFGNVKILHDHVTGTNIYSCMFWKSKH